MKIFKRIFLGIIILLILVLGGVVIFSPYGTQEGYTYKLISNTIEISAPVDSVFAFLGNSANASRWSVFVNHITPINIDSVADGKVGSRRKCYCNADESGKKWEEL